MKHIFPHSLSGTLKVPASKSIMQRAIAAAVLAKGESRLHNISDCEDGLAAIEVAKALGAKIEQQGDTLTIESNGVQPIVSEINCGEAGLGIRMFTPIAALSDKELIIKAEGSLKTRPMHFFEEVFPKVKVQCTLQDGKAPIHIKGALQAQNLEVDGSLSSQFLTGLLMSMASVSMGNIISVNHLTSRPYLDLTLSVMRDFGVKVLNFQYEKFVFPGAQRYLPQNFYIEGDWSAAAFWVVAAAIQGEITLQGLRADSLQADRAILDIICAAGADYTINQEGSAHFPEITISPAKKLQAFTFDATHAPDLFPILAVLAVHCQGISEIKGVNRLLHKESNRAAAIVQEFQKVGADLVIKDDILYIHGENIPAFFAKNTYLLPNFHAHKDHRMAMALTILAHTLKIKATIDDAECVKKSYPHFFEEVEKIGFEKEA
ncbi:MAG: 3-phosphoshikimate 1-carboxyvinyltransferase [Bacteroidia bacterium]